MQLHDRHTLIEGRGRVCPRRWLDRRVKYRIRGRAAKGLKVKQVTNHTNECGVVVAAGRTIFMD